MSFRDLLARPPRQRPQPDRIASTGLRARHGGFPRVTGGLPQDPAPGRLASGWMSPVPTPIVQASGLSKTYGSGETAITALDDVSVDFRAGELTAIMGPSGSGKSTLMHCIAGLDRADAGTVTIDGVEITDLDDRHLTELRRDRIGFVFQAFNLLPVLTAEENILLPLTIAGREPDPEWLEQLVTTIGLGDRRHHRPSELSGGQQQRVAVARALASRPAVGFADEPTGNLDSRSSDEILGLLRHSVDGLGQSVVMVTHDPHAASFADRLLVLKDGRIVHDGPAGGADDVHERLRETSDPTPTA
jgi:putative ABC transport system ATP-binding protein